MFIGQFVILAHHAVYQIQDGIVEQLVCIDAFVVVQHIELLGSISTLSDHLFQLIVVLGMVHAKQQFFYHGI
tara:strand:+ start:607 stop:822 length:216 start_codon:yes stop_codon:yes gene_type:complete